MATGKRDPPASIVLHTSSLCSCLERVMTYSARQTRPPSLFFTLAANAGSATVGAPYRHWTQAARRQLPHRREARVRRSVRMRAGLGGSAHGRRRRDTGASRSEGEADLATPFEVTSGRPVGGGCSGPWPMVSKWVKAGPQCTRAQGVSWALREGPTPSAGPGALATFSGGPPMWAVSACGDAVWPFGKGGACAGPGCLAS